MTKIFLVEQLYSRLKLNKNVVLSFINKLNSNDIIILNKNLNAYIAYIKDNYKNVNDYILKNSFNELKKIYNVKELQQKNKEIIAQNQAAMSQTIQENVPRDTLEEAEDEGAEDAKPKEAEEVKKNKVKKIKKNQKHSLLKTKKRN